MRATSTITHIVAMPAQVTEHGDSYFQGFANDWFPDAIRILHAIRRAPHDIMELALRGSQFVLSRSAGSNLSVKLLRTDLFDSDHLDLQNPLQIVWSTNQSAAEVYRAIADLANPPLHITVGECEGAIALDSLTDESMHDLIKSLLEKAVGRNAEHRIANEYIKSKTHSARNEGRLSFIPAMHNCTAPMIEVLKVYGYQTEEVEPISPSVDSKDHINGMVQLADAIDDLRKDAREVPVRKNDGLIYCPSVFSYLYKADSQHWNRLYRTLDKPRRNFIKQFLIRNKGFGNGGSYDFQEVFNPYEDKVVGTLLVSRQQDMQLITALVALVATNQFIPAIRLPHSVMLHHDRLKNIYQLSNSNRPDRDLRLNRLVSDYTGMVKQEIGDALFSSAFDDREKILAVCDFPIEWLPIEDVPIMFRKEISRVPMTPGNAAAQQLCLGERILVHPSELANILVIRSFRSDDPIRNHLSIAIDGFKDDDKLAALNIQIVDVQTELELIDALNQFRGSIAIFDCHGNHGGETEHAWLQIGKERVDVWNLANRCHIPPISILAACSTHALDGSHASVANGLLRSGAMCVVGTFAPVGAIHMGIAVARLLYRIAVYLPIASSNLPITWRDVVSGFFRMSYVTDILQDLHTKRKLLSKEQYFDIHMDANSNINGKDRNWVEKFFEKMKACLGIDEHQLRETLRRDYQFVETMLLVQLGRPENIMIYSGELPAIPTTANE